MFSSLLAYNGHDLIFRMPDLCMGIFVRGLCGCVYSQYSNEFSVKKYTLLDDKILDD